jgi:hypothetical protein
VSGQISTPPLRSSLPEMGAIAAVSGGASAHSAETVVAGPILWEPEPELPAHEPPPLPERSADVLQQAAQSTETAVSHELPPPSSNFEETFAAAPPTVVQPGSDAEGSFYQVFQEYVLTREKCREPMEGLSYELFRQRLQESRAQIMQQHGCRGVDFRVYIKDGKAALRARPLWT